jgi:hypothetical protein
MVLYPEKSCLAAVYTAYTQAYSIKGHAISEHLDQQLLTVAGR